MTAYKRKDSFQFQEKYCLELICLWMKQTAFPFQMRKILNLCQNVVSA